MNTTKYNLDITKYLDSAKRINIAITNKQWFKESEDYNKILQETKWVNELNPKLSVNARMLLIRDNITEFKKCIHCDVSLKFNNTINKTANFCSKSCARRHNNDRQIQTTKDKTEELYKTSSILSKEDLKYNLLKLKEKNINVCYSFVVLNRAGLAKSLDHYISEDLELSVKANMFINDEFELNVCKNLECLNKVKHNKHEYCSVSCQVIDKAETRINTYFDRTGYLHPHHNPIVLESMKNNSLIKWGYINPQLHPDVLQKTQKTSIERYGVRNYNQLGNKVNMPNFNFKTYHLPSGKTTPYQGYEDKLLDELLKEYSEEEIINMREDMPEIWYIGLDNKSHRYFPDMYIPKTNTIYEVKSEYTLNLEYEINMLKFQAVRDAGYNFELRIY